MVSCGGYDETSLKCDEKKGSWSRRKEEGLGLHQQLIFFLRSRSLLQPLHKNTNDSDCYPPPPSNELLFYKAYELVSELLELSEN